MVLQDHIGPTGPTTEAPMPYWTTEKEVRKAIRKALFHIVSLQKEIRKEKMQCKSIKMPVFHIMNSHIV